MLREDIGTDLTAERLLPRWVRNNGLIGVRTVYHPAIVGAGDPGGEFLRASLNQLQPAIVGASRMIRGRWDLGATRR